MTFAMAKDRLHGHLSNRMDHATRISRTHLHYAGQHQTFNGGQRDRARAWLRPDASRSVSRIALEEHFAIPETFDSSYAVKDLPSPEVKDKLRGRPPPYVFAGKRTDTGDIDSSLR